MRRVLAAVVPVLISVTVLAGCGEDGKPESQKEDPGMNATQNAATGTKFFTAVGSNDPAEVEAAYVLAAPGSPALSYLKLLRDGLEQAGPADTLTEAAGRYRLCKADKPAVCHTFAAVTLSDGKVNDFTVDGKHLRLR